MNKRTILIVALSLFFFPMISVAQGAYSDLWHAMQYSQQAANAHTSEEAAHYASQAFYSSGNNSSHTSSNTTSYVSGPTITRATPQRRSATNTSNVGLKISSSGYNRGAELARIMAERRAELARRKAERDARLLASFMAQQYESSNKMEANWLIYIDDNSHAKPFSQEEINDFISRGLTGNMVIDDNGNQNLLSENLLEGSGEKLETLEEKLRSMSDTAIDKFAEELNKKLDKGEKLSDEELLFLIAREQERIARLEEENRQLEEIRRKIEKEINNAINISF